MAIAGSQPHNGRYKGFSLSGVQGHVVIYYIGNPVFTILTTFRQYDCNLLINLM